MTQRFGILVVLYLDLNLRKYESVPSCYCWVLAVVHFTIKPIFIPRGEVTTFSALDFFKRLKLWNWIRYEKTINSNPPNFNALLSEKKIFRVIHALRKLRWSNKVCIKNVLTCLFCLKKTNLKSQWQPFSLCKGLHCEFSRVTATSEKAIHQFTGIWITLKNTPFQK